MSTTTRLGPALPERVAILRALQLGDMLCAIPALRALRVLLPRAHVTLIGLPWARELVSRFPSYLDDFLEFPGWPGLPERATDIATVPEFLADAQRRRFDLVIQLHGSGTFVNPLAALLGGDRVAGYVTRGGYSPDLELFLPYPEQGHEIRRTLRLVEFLGASDADERLEFPVTDADRSELSQVLADATIDLGSQPYACIHPGSRAVARRWDAAQFARVGDALAAQGIRVVLTGTAGERLLTRDVALQMRAPVLDLAGRTSLGALAALVSGAALVVCNDTGVSHLAAALQVPSLVIFLTSDPARWAPLDEARHRVVDGQAANEETVVREALKLLGRIELEVVHAA